MKDGQLHTASELAERELVPQAFAYKILKKLARAELLQVVRGAEGGWRLIADLENTTLHDLIAAIDQGYTVNACMEPGYRCTWREERGTCGIHQCLCSVQREVEQVLKRHTLASFLEPCTETLSVPLT